MGELDERSSRLARWLIGRGVGAEQVVVLLMPRSVALAVAIWAVAKSGAAFVAVDPEYPASRVEHMLADSGARVALTVAGVDGPGGFEWVVVGESGLRRRWPGSRRRRCLRVNWWRRCRWTTQRM